jgi:hypothetical protein
MSAAPLRESGWILLGVLLGTAACMAMIGPPAGRAMVDPLSIATLAVFAMLAGSASPQMLRPVAHRNS